MRFGPYLAFLTLWSVCVYAPVAHWVWGGGWLQQLGALDFAGGTVVHINAAAAALVAALVLKPRKDFARQAILPHNVPFTLLGAGLLWFGWFGFNGGSALGANVSAALAFVNTMLAPDRHALRLDAARLAPHGQGHGRRRGDRHRRRPRGDHARGRIRVASLGHPDRGGLRPFRATSLCSGGRVPGWMTRSTSSRRTAWEARSAPC